MDNFDPVAETNRLLAVLPQDAHEKALHYTQGGHWLLLWGFVVATVASLIILKLGWLTKIRDGLEKNKPRPWLVAFLCALTFMAVDWVLELPWASYTGWYREKSYGMQNQDWLGWLTDGLKVLPFEVIGGAIFITLVYWLIRKAPRIWPLLAGALTAVFFLLIFTVEPLVIEPMLNHYTPAPAGPVRDLVVEMGHQVGVPTDKIFIYDGSKQSNRYTANVAGMFGTARVAMSDVMFKKGADMAEVKGVVGHEMGHYVHQHGLWGAAAFALLIVIEAWLVTLLFPLIQGWVGARSIGGLADPAGLPVLAIAFGVISLLFTPVQSSLSRFTESDADSFSLKNFDEPDGLAKALVKTIEYRYDSPGKLEEIMFYDHPSVRARVQKAMDWKAAHMKAAEPAPPAAAPAASAAAPASSASPPASSAG